MDDDVKDKIEKLVREGVDKPCVMCETMTKNRGVFTPKSKAFEEFGVPPGKTRLIVYPFCGNHPETELNFTAVEEALLESLRRGNINFV